MNFIKVFGLAVLATAAMTVLGASSGVAGNTSLCTEASAGLACPAEKQASHVHAVSAKANSQLLNETLNVSCTTLFLGDTVGGTLGSPLLIEGTATFSSCTTFCSVSEKNGPAHIEILKTAAGLADVTGEGLINVNCFGFFNCNYIGENVVGHGHSAGHVTFSSDAVKSEAGGSCPSSASVDALFVPLESSYFRS